MHFKLAKPNENFPFRYTYKNIEVGIYPVLFGYRVRAGFIGSAGCEIDWCCGDNPHTIRTYFQLLIEILEWGAEKDLGKEIFTGIPLCSKIKPLVNDLDFLKEVLSIPRTEVPLITIPPLYQIRNAAFNDEI